jgi:chemotaxis protein histidine kinase CheA
MAAVDPFIERLARVRQRFVSALEGKIDETDAAIPNLSGAAPAASETVGETYRRIHSIVGIGPTVGFAATGTAARGLETVLSPAHHAGRGLTEQEVGTFRKALQVLREAAARDLQAFHSGAP